MLNLKVFAKSENISITFSEYMPLSLEASTMYLHQGIKSTIKCLKLTTQKITGKLQIHFDLPGIKSRQPKLI